jgi:hypothetical protein
MSVDMQHRLEGLEPDNLLAFLALLGLLRTLELAVPDWRPRLHWEGAPLRPMLTLAVATTQEEVAEATARGATELAKDHDFAGEADLTFDRRTARDLLDTAATPALASRSALLGCLFSDGAVKEDGTVLATPFCAMFGQGHQHFLSRLSQVPRGVLPKALARQRKPPDLNGACKIAEALFRPWARIDPTESFRWDPMEDRRYAMRFKNPSDDPGCTVHGANRLASLGIAALPGAAVERRGRLRFLILGSDLGPDGLVEITWPIWERPTTLSALQALVGHPALSALTPDMAQLSRFGIKNLRRARRISVGKYFNFTRAEAL